MKKYIAILVTISLMAASLTAADLSITGVSSDRFFYRNEGKEIYIILKKSEPVSFSFTPSVSVTESTLSLTFSGGTVASGSGKGPYAVTYSSDGGEPKPITFSVDRPDPEDSEKTCTTTSSTAGRVVVPKITIDKVWSDQYPDRENVNFFTRTDSSGTGKDHKEYILMGERDDGKGHAKATITMSPEMDELKDLLIVRFGTMSGSTFTQTGEGSIESDKVTASISDGNAPSEVLVAAGLDFNKNGELDSDEVFDKTQYKLRIIGPVLYNYARVLITTGSTVVGLYPADDFLATFAFSDNTMYGCTASDVTINKSQVGHAVGAHYDASGDATIKKFSYPASSSLASDLINSYLVQDLINGAFTTNAPEVTSYFAANPTAAPKTFNWNIASGVHTFTGWDLSLYFAFKSCNMNLNLAVTVDNTLNVTKVKITGSVDDKYDWDYDKDLTAVVQAGYDTVGPGGRIFLNFVAIDETLIGSHHF